MAAYSSKTGNPEAFAQQMKLGLFSKEFSDVKFVVGDQRKVIHGHRIIIGLRCPLLQKMFQESSSKPEVPIILSDVSPETFQLMLEFMYTNSVQMNHNSSMDLLGTSIEYGLQDLQAVVCEFITSSLDVEFAANAMHAAVYFEVADLEKNCLTYIAANATDFFRSKAFLEMGELAFLKVVECSDLDVDEYEIHRAIFEWTKNASLKGGNPMKTVALKVVRHLRIAIFDVETLETVENFSANEGDYIPADMFQFAWKFHAQINSDKNVPVVGKEWASLRKGTKSQPHHKYLNEYIS